MQAAYTSYKNRPIFFTDVGFSSAPANIEYPFTSDISKIQLRHNNKMMIGFGGSFRWFSIRFGAALIGNSKPVSQYGKSNYFDLGLQFSIKKTYSELDLKSYSGYVLKNAYTWDPTLNTANPNDKNQDINMYDIAYKMWYLHNKNFKMDPFNGNRGVYNRQVLTWYLEGRIEWYGISNRRGSLIPTNLYDSTNTKTASSSLNAFELGLIPGFGYVNNIKNFQYGFLAALGPRLQIKSYNVNDMVNSAGGIVFRYDFKTIIGYNTTRFFAMLHLEIDNKSINFDKFKYNQTFFSLKLQTGYRFKEIPKKDKKKNRKN